MWHLLMELELEQTPQQAGTVIHILRRRLGLLVHLIANVIDERGFGELLRLQAHHIHAGLLRPPTYEMQQSDAVESQGQQLQSPHALHIEEAVDPFSLAALFIYQAEG
jgi:hypothetical protein